MPLPPETAAPESFDMTPMIDIVFQLLVFFMLVSDLSRQVYAPVLLPAASRAVRRDRDPDPIVLTVMADGTILAGGRKLAGPGVPGSPGALDDYLERQAGRAGAERRPVVVRADRSAEFQWIQLALSSAAVRGGATRVEFAAVRREE